jgi:cobalt-precorrin 5A hydrolase / precorrin-3B C17-methyltransferase
MNTPAIVVLGPTALPLARKLRGPLFAEIHGPEGLEGCNVIYAKATDHLAELFRAGRPIIGICASGILIRAIGALAIDKQSEPPVIAVSEGGAAVVPLLGGHHGANELAQRIASITSGHAAITTASDVVLGVSLDEVPEGYALADPTLVKQATARLLRGERLLFIEGQAPWLNTIASPEGTIPVAVSIRVPQEGAITYHPKTLAVGIGCERGASIQEVQQLVSETLEQFLISPAAIGCFASIDLKEDEAAIAAFGDVRFFSTKELNAQSGRIAKPSEIVRAEVGTPSVAEAAALAAAGPDAQLIVTKQKSKRATVAIAEAPAPILAAAGRTRGCVHVVGLGPGTPSLRSPLATSALAGTTDWVGYTLYLDLAKDQHTDQRLHEFPLGGEEDRCRHAIKLAKEGKQVALICSGDAAIYAMAALVYELIDREPCRVGVEVHPGISAFQLASARAGALIGHDFCCISLSDLLTPWEAIERRVKSAAEGDFVIAFYNPRSLKRVDQIIRAFEFLKPHRHPDTPVILASNLGRPEENVRVLNFSEFDPQDVDMLTVVLVGSSQSRVLKRGDGKAYAYTPRGYAKKMDLPQEGLAAE